MGVSRNEMKRLNHIVMVRLRTRRRCIGTSEIGIRRERDKWITRSL